MINGRLEQAGLDALALSLGGAMEWSPDGDRLFTPEALELTADGLFRFNIGFDFDGAMDYLTALEEWEQRIEAKSGVASLDPDAVPSDITDRLILNAMSFELEDLGALDLAFEILAEEQGSTAEAMRLQAGFMVGLFMVGAAKDIPPSLAGDLQSALLSFIADGGQLRFEMSPPEPMSLSALEAETITPDELGLSVSHSNP